MAKLRRALIPAMSVATLAALAAIGLTQPSDSQPLPSTAASFSTPQPGESAQAQRGRYLAVLGDCMACHTKAGGGAPYAGGRAIGTPFGAILSANITSAAMGAWTDDQFYRALHEGIDAKGRHLYPAFPYNYFTRMTRADSDALLAYLKTVPGVPGEVQTDILPFPFNIRALMIVWNGLYLKKGEFQPNPQQSAEWNRGAYLVEGPGHCGACHTPKSALGGDLQSRRYQGGVLDEWLASNLTGNARFGLGGWSADDVAQFLKTGRNARSAATGAMAEVVAFSTSQMSDADVRAIAVYLKSLPAMDARAVPAADPATMKAGEAIFTDSCSACHRMNGQAVPGAFPPLPGNANAQQADPTTLARIILNGARSQPTAARPTPLSMPAYNWKLTDAEVAAVATYVRNSWGNSAPPVTAAQVAAVRKKTAQPRS
jgi:mono/diheme cytochrome c family protein